MFKVGDRVYHFDHPHVHGTVTSTNHVKGNFYDNVNVQWDQEEYFSVPFAYVRYLRHVDSIATKSPVREVTRREIVPGNYGRVVVGKTYETGIWFEISVDEKGSLILTAEELDNVAMIASQLAEVLRNV